MERSKGGEELETCEMEFGIPCEKHITCGVLKDLRLRNGYNKSARILLTSFGEECRLTGETVSFGNAEFNAVEYAVYIQTQAFRGSSYDLEYKLIHLFIKLTNY